MVVWAHILWVQYSPDTQTQERSGVLIREKEPGVPSASDIGLSALQTFWISHIYVLVVVLKEGGRKTLINTVQNNKSSPGRFSGLGKRFIHICYLSDGLLVPSNLLIV